MALPTSTKGDELLTEKRNAIIGTIRKDGTPQLTPVTFLWDGEALRFSTTKTRAKYYNLLRDPRITIIVDDHETTRYVTLYGSAEIDDRPEQIIDTIREIRRKYRGQAGADSVTVEELQRDTRVLVTVRPERIV
ncbi:MAG TPA: PPOX class F420-dependent oxidoreductase [Dehalococcoidia bacterium]|nr:PPOX class F420-dependent oxidoreductase [Dehalococcoidia bacterium]